MKDILKFLSALSRHNDREWFEAHRADYLRVKERFEEFAARFIESVAASDPTVEGLSVRDCTYRIYRDVRFSADKRPYKTHMGVYVAPHGKKAGYAGYYIHVQPDEENYFLCAGLYNPISASTGRALASACRGAGEPRTSTRTTTVCAPMRYIRRLTAIMCLPRISLKMPWPSCSARVR